MFRPKIFSKSKRFFVSLIAIFLIFNQLSFMAPALAYGAEAQTVESEAAPAEDAKLAAEDGAKAGTGKTVLAFSSDVHNGGSRASGNVSAERMSAWIDNVVSEYGGIDVMAFCGDMGSAGANESQFWTLTKAAMDAVDDKGITQVHTTGNHEYYNGQYGSTSNSVKNEYIIDDEAMVGDNFRIYCLGTNMGTGTWSGTDYYSSGQISALETYLNGVGTDKPIIILTHFPLHTYSSRSTNDADQVIDVLNTASADGKKIVLLWGHNHSVSDTYYDQIYKPGDSIEYARGSNKEIQFYYGAAGCMSDTENGTGSAFVKGKGLVITIDNDKKLSFTYYDANANNVTEDGTFTEQDPVAVTGVSIDQTSATVAVGKKTKLTATISPADATYKKVTWSSADTEIATVDESGNVKGIAEGTTTITATAGEADTRALYTDSIQVTVTARNGGTYYVLTNELNEDSNYLIVSAKTEGIAYAITNNGSSSSGTAMGSTQVDIVSGDINNDGVNDLYIDTDEENIIWEATANAGGVDLANDDGYLQGAQGNVRVFSPKYYGDRYWTYNNEALEFKGGSYTYEVYYSNNAFAYRNYNSGSAQNHIYIFEQMEIVGNDPVSGVALNKNSLELAQGASETLIATVAPATAANKNVTWSSSNPSVATVSNGTVTGIAEGTAAITVTTADGGYTATCNVTVTREVTMTYVQADTMEPGKEYLIANGNSGSVYIVSTEAAGSRQLQGVSVNVVDGRITIPTSVAADTAFTCYLEDESNPASTRLKIGTQDLYTNSADGLRMFTMTDNEADKHWHYRADGKYLLWFFKDTTSSDGYTDTNSTYKYYLECNNGIFTDNHVSTTSLSNTDTPKMYLFVKSTPVTGVTVTPESEMIAVGEESQLTATVAPADASVKTVTWSSSDTSVATVDSTGKVTGVATGTATITATTTDGGFTDTCEVTVGIVDVTGVTLDKNTALVETGKTTQLRATVIPANATNKNVSWNSSDETVATVDEDGLITGVGEGTAVITVTTEDGSKTAACNVTVTTTVVRPGYVIVIGNYALSTTEESDYHPEGTNNANKYYGLKGVEYDTADEPDENILWTITEAEGVQNGYYIQSLDGRYLNATYKNDDPIEGHLKLDDTPDIWVLDGDLEDWIISGSYLQSTNATDDSKELCLAYENDGAAGSINLFTIRSRSNADSSELTSPDITAEVRYVETDALKDGGEYIIAVTKDAGSVYAVKNVATGTTSTNTGSVTLEVSSEGTETPYIITADTGVPWKYTGSNQYMTNNSFYLSYSNNVPRASASTGRAISYNEGNLRFARSTTGSYYYLTCSNGTFGTGSGDAASVRLFEKRSIVTYAIKWVGANGAVLYTDELARGETPVYNGPTPTKADDDQFRYNFIGWSPEVSAVTGLAVYTAQFEAVPKQMFTVTFLDDDGVTVIATRSVSPNTEWGEFDMPADPTKAATADYRYEFAGWDPAITAVTGDATYTATYNAIARTYGAPVWDWTGSDEAGYTSAKATIMTNDGEAIFAKYAVDDSLDINTVDATCETAGKTTYTATVTIADQEYTETKEVETQAPGHVWQFSGFSWQETEDGGYTAAAEYVCERDASHTESVPAVVAVNKTDPTCTEAGTATYSALVAAGISPDQAEHTGSKTVETEEALGHNWGTVTYQWEKTDDGYKCSAGHICQNDPAHVETETVEATSEVTKPATCEGKGETTYTAAFENTSFKTQTQTVEDIEAKGHAYGEPTYMWSENNSSVTATRVCANDDSHVETETVETTSSTIAPTCTAAGSVIYTAVFTKEGFSKQTKITTGEPATGHAYGEPTYEWSEDLGSVTATRVCANDDSHVETETVNTTSEVTKEATCEEKGETTYTATFENTAFATQTKTVEDIEATGHTEEVLAAVEPTCTEPGLTEGTKCSVCGEILKAQEEIPATGHVWGEVIYEWADDNSTVTATRVCANDAEHVETETADAVYTLTKAAACEEDGTGTYTATFTNTAFETQTKDVTVEATGHDWKLNGWTWAEDYSNAAAGFICANDPSHEETFETDEISVERVEPTPEKAGSITYTATVKGPDNNYYTCSKAEIIPPTGYTYGNPVYSWNEETFTVTATLVCNEDETKNIEETVEAVYIVTKAAACEEDGVGVYTAEFENTMFETQTKEVTIPATGHDWGSAQWQWSADNTSATATFVCKNDSEHKQTVDGVVTSEETAATCKETGKTVYTAGVTFEGKTYEYAKEVTIPATGHAWDDGTVTTEATYLHTGEKTYTCTVCKETRTEVIEKKTATKKWIQEDGEWYYFGSDSKLVTNGWAKDSTGWCWLGNDGKITKSKWIQYNGEWYYLKADGYMAANEWAKDSKGWMWMDASGKITKNKWIQYKGEWYYLKANGYMAANEWAKDSKGWMWMDAGGKITKNKWIQYNGNWYYLKADGYMAANEYASDSTKTYWMGSDGRIAS